MSLDQIIQLIEKGDFPTVFQHLEKRVSGAYKATFEAFKHEFVQGIDDVQRVARLKVMASEFFAKHQEISILVLTNTKEQIEKALYKTSQNTENQQDKGKQDVLARYGENAQSWKPYLNETIEELLGEFPKRCHFKVKPFYITTQNIGNKHEFLRKINTQKAYHILIADGLAFCHDNIKSVALEFNDVHIGGCLMPICETLPTKVQKKAREQIEALFKDKLHYWIYNYADLQEKDTGFVYIDLEVPNKHQFLRKLSHIAHFHLAHLDIPQEFEDLNNVINSNKQNILDQISL